MRRPLSGLAYWSNLVGELGSVYVHGPPFPQCSELEQRLRRSQLVDFFNLAQPHLDEACLVGDEQCLPILFPRLAIGGTLRLGDMPPTGNLKNLIINKKMINNKNNNKK